MKLLKPTKQRGNKKKIFGFDIETYNDNKDFYCASIFLDEKTTWFTKDKDELIRIFSSYSFRDSFIAATNLQFDFFGLFFGKDAVKHFNLVFNGSKLLSAKTYVDKDGFHKRKTKNSKPLTFIDTMNYCQMSVEQIGELLNIPKLDKPSFIGQLPKNIQEEQEMKEYNMRDAKISKEYIQFLFDAFSELGATPKMTIASTSMSLFRNKYLKDTYFQADKNRLLEQFEGYYGGRVEAFLRGKINNVNYYDINSLYPYVMKGELPDPNSLRITRKNTLRYIEEYEGMSKVDIYCPDMDYPLLPYKHDSKLLFPTGSFTGWYTHIELRKAISLGYVIKFVHKTHYFKSTCKPFDEYVDDLYSLRKRFKEQGNIMESVVKLLLNSLYGKFGQKFMDKDNFQPFTHTKEELDKLKSFEIVGDYIKIKEDREPSCFCIPIWASYITSKARLVLYEYIKRYKAMYCDTDSIITTETIPTGKELGEMKLEMEVTEGYIIRPKFYAVRPLDIEKAMTKVKGLGKRLTYQEFKSFMLSPSINYKKILKFKEAIRRGMIPNQSIDFRKEMGLDDDKRLWDEKKFNPIDLQLSIPRHIYHTNEKLNNDKSTFIWSEMEADKSSHSEKA